MKTSRAVPYEMGFTPVPGSGHLRLFNPALIFHSSSYSISARARVKTSAENPSHIEDLEIHA